MQGASAQAGYRAEHALTPDEECFPDRLQVIKSCANNAIRNHGFLEEYSSFISAHHERARLLSGRNTRLIGLFHVWRDCESICFWGSQV